MAHFFNLINKICTHLPVENQLCKMDLKFKGSTLCRINKLVSLCGRFALGGNLSKASNSMTYITHRFNANQHELLKKPELQVHIITDIM